MVRLIDNKEREEEFLGLIVESYIQETKPISSAYLCNRYNLNCSSATIRNVMVALEKQGFLSHIYTSSGRVPTQDGFKRYVDSLKKEDIGKYTPLNLDFCSITNGSIEVLINYTLEVLTEFSGYTSLVALSGKDGRLFFKGVRCILDQPEFEDIERLKHIIYALEVRMSDIQDLLFSCIDDEVKIVIGDDIGFSEISDCSLVISGLKEKDVEFAIALLGPIRMNYMKATACLNSVREQLEVIVDNFL